MTDGVTATGRTVFGTTFGVVGFKVGLDDDVTTVGGDGVVEWEHNHTPMVL